MTKEGEPWEIVSAGCQGGWAIRVCCVAASEPEVEAQHHVEQHIELPRIDEVICW